MKTVLKERLTNVRAEVRQALLKAQVPNRGLGILEQGVSVQLATEQDVAAARKALADLLQTRSEGSANVLLFDIHDHVPAFVLHALELQTELFAHSAAAAVAGE